MLTATGFTPLLVNLESMTSKPNVEGGSKKYVAWPSDESSVAQEQHQVAA